VYIHVAHGDVVVANVWVTQRDIALKLYRLLGGDPIAAPLLALVALLEFVTIVAVHATSAQVVNRITARVYKTSA
jgi:hypothetical protein